MGLVVPNLMSHFLPLGNQIELNVKGEGVTCGFVIGGGGQVPPIP